MFEAKESMAGSFPMFRDKDIGGSFILYVEIEEVSELYRRIKDKVTIVKAIENTEYGTKEFSILDRNGLMIIFAEWTGIKDFFKKSVYDKKKIIKTRRRVS